MSIITLENDFKARGFIAQASLNAASVLQPGEVAYAGFDPTADSLHVGNLVTIMGLARMQRARMTPIALVGGATGLIGDPSGRSSDRPLLSRDNVQTNAMSIKEQLRNYIDFSGPFAGKMTNNIDWFGTMDLITYLRDIAGKLRANQLLNKEAVRTRLESEDGIGLNEFLYPTLQGYDFFYLWRAFGCKLQIGGSDQWGNMVTGIEIARKLEGAQLHAVTHPLLTTASGAKFGKSAGNAVWLAVDKTSVFSFYQYFLNADDQDVERYLLLLTFLPVSTIQEIMKEHGNAPQLRKAQNILADEVTRTVHGDTQLEQAKSMSRAVFDGNLQSLNALQLQDAFQSSASIIVPFEEAVVLDICMAANIFNSKGEARRMIDNGGLYLNGQRVTSTETQMTSNWVEGQVAVLSVGRDRHWLMKRAIGRPLTQI